MAAPKIFLRAVRIEAFRSCERTSFEPRKDVSVLIGRNGAGKTNVLQAITLLGAWAKRAPLYKRKSEGALSHCRIFAEFQVGRAVLALRSTLSYTIDEENAEQVVSARDEWREGSIDGSPKDWQFVFPELGARKDWTAEELYWMRRSFPLSALTRGEKASTRSLETKVARVLAFRNSIGYYSASQFTNPATCPSSIEIDEDRDLIRPTRGRYQHQRFLFDLYRLKEGSSRKYTSYLSLVGKDGLKLISTVDWKEVKVASSQVEVRAGGKIVKRNRNRLLVVPSVKIGSDRLSFSQLSEGTFKSLALIFYLMTDDSELLLIEEPEVCVHHGLLVSIVELIEAQGSRKQIIFSTHSDFVLDRVQPEQVFMTVMRASNGTAVRALTKYPKQTVATLRNFLRTSGNLGEFWRNGGLT